MIRCNTTSCCELEQLVLKYIASNPKCSIEDIASSVNYQYAAVYRILEGRSGSCSLIGLVNTGTVRAIPGINSKGNLCWNYELI